MPTRQEILDALQFDLTGLTANTLNVSGAAPFQFTYQFANGVQPDDLDLDETYSDWRAMTGAEKNAVRDGLQHIETIANVEFIEVSGQADPDLNFGMAEMPGLAGLGGYRYFYSFGGELIQYDGFALFDEDLNIANTPGLILHEIGHALTLQHPFHHGDALPAEFENNKYTLMSYTPNPDIGEDGDVLQLYDIYALQERWGANTATNAGNTTYTGPRSETVDAIWDAGGIDWISAEKHFKAANIDLRQGEFSQFGSYEDMVIAYDTVIENAKGSRFGDTITGNASSNEIYGNAGSDKISTGGANDQAYGGDGNDRIDGEAGADTLRGNKGDDRLFGGEGKDFLAGGKNKDLLVGGEGDDTLMGGRGADTLEGNEGNDQLYGDFGQDTFIFREDDDEDKIFGFQDDLDTIRFDIDGVTTVTEAQSFALQVGNHVVYDFGGGDRLQVNNMQIVDLWDDLIIV
ncbi:MAG: M10 family metallopeptidase [Pseudomonadota bacterium]